MSAPPDGAGVPHRGMADPAAFIRANTVATAPPLVPEIRLHTATELTPIWQATETSLETAGVDPPYWAFAWAGGQALARHVLDNPALVRGRRVLDFGAGSGIVGIACVMAGAAHVASADIDPTAAAAVALNVEVNGAVLDGAVPEIVTDDLVGGPNRGWDIVLAGDVCYEKPMAERVEAWLKVLVAEGVEVLLGDPIRGYLPKSGLERVVKYAVQTTREIEDSDLRNAVVWRLVE